MLYERYARTAGLPWTHRNLVLLKEAHAGDVQSLTSPTSGASRDVVVPHDWPTLAIVADGQTVQYILGLTYNAGDEVAVRLTHEATALDRVTQHWEYSIDDGATWTVGLDVVLARRP